jgi:hypothetical protein
VGGGTCVVGRLGPFLGLGVMSGEWQGEACSSGCEGLVGLCSSLEREAGVGESRAVQVTYLRDR